MSTLTSTNVIRRSVQLSIAAALLVTASVSAQADEISISNTVAALEQNMTQASQEMISNVKQELMLSLQTQIAEQVFEINSALEFASFEQPQVSTAVAAENK
ncbi:MULTISPECIES: hypothetical protein [Shewanella]|jgi:hypothetical protein|uniref:Uncharacterized protein n=1 Tax=Shewanella frigidimarina TaxID=56812 RepID=A0A125BEU9_SHEFR|nr:MULTISPECIES: hypothetical protein [Shewanella]KVX02950.1 hypothetical protein AWJ07_11635 [Shewanella frigidimarina]MBB1360621.1 hypothetical protein [Shewanella sp. SR44-4]MBB1428596.1 hypothetical protein [Shewanella sp. SG44-2]MBO1898051.1 hypothetical protein [Shewanella sp. BF02_Schw]PKH34722.1 hypothetical protein CXF88_02670 [Shewanella sp. ALD9]|tara:strand:+ start:500 stop:805 length:306 start_codon:yes stop_codon:yes gene_type:complete